MLCERSAMTRTLERRRWVSRSRSNSESHVTQKIVLFAALLFAALIAGGQYVVWWDYNAAGMSAVFYTQKMQFAIRVIGTPLFAVQCTAALLTITSAWLARHQRATFKLLIAACACYVIAVLLTVFGAIPALNQMAAWNADSPPAYWRDVADRWWWIHTIRFAMQIAGLSLLIVAAIRGLDQRPRP